MPADQPTRARESINVLRLMPNVRQAAALVAPASNAAITAGKLFGIDSSRPPAPATTTTSRREAGLNALLDQ